MKKFFALVLALAMVMSLALPAMAAEEPTYSLTINNTATGHTYDAYQIFNGKLTGTILTDILWGDSIADGAALLAALKADETPVTQTTGTTTLKDSIAAYETEEKDPVTSAAALARYMAKSMDPQGSPLLDRAAAIIGNVEYDANGGFVKHTYLNDTPIATTSTSTDGKYVLSGLPAGYYLVKDRDGSQNPDTNPGDFYTKYIINLPSETAINVKGDGVTVEKSINTQLGGTYGDIADFDIFDTAYYKWVGDLPSNLSEYDEYNYKFIDTLPYGIEFKRIETIDIVNKDEVVIQNLYTAEGTADPEVPVAGLDLVTTENGKVTLNVVNIFDATEHPEVTEAQDQIQEEITLNFENLMVTYPHLLATHKVVVKYSATVTRNAVMAEAMTNDVVLIYDNNPNGEGQGKTVHDHAHAFTFSIEVDKYDAANPSKKLKDVKFHLYYKSIDPLTGEETKYYALVVTEEDVPDKTVNGVSLHLGYLGNIYGWTDNVEDASVLDTDVNGYLRVEGLDKGIYYLEEIDTVDGYNMLHAPVKVEIIPNYTPSCTGTGAAEDCDADVNVEYKVDDNSQGGSNLIKIPNSQGTVLPTTGGMGTTLFYVFGGLMVAAAAVLLVTKKRMSAEN